MSNTIDTSTEVIYSNELEFIISNRYSEFDRMPDYVLIIERLVEFALLTDDCIFKKNHQNKYPPSYGTYLEDMPSLINSYLPDLFYSSKVDLFYTSCRQLGWDKSIPTDPNAKLENGECAGDLFNKLIDIIRIKGRSREFKQTELKRISNAKRGFESARRYLNSLFLHHARLCVVRIDLSYSSKMSQAEVPLARVQQDFKKLIHGWKDKPVFTNMVGYIAKLEYGELKKHHFHVMFFFDGSKSHQDIRIAMRIGIYWHSITNQQGIYFNCNANKSLYRYLGIGMVSHDDNDKRFYLEKSLQYFFKKEQFLKYKYKEKTRTYFRGEVNNKEKSLAGRPRRV